MPRAVADKHTVIWYTYDDARLSPVARAWIESAAADGEQIAISFITLVEMTYLVEKGRIDAAALTRLTVELDAADAVLVEVPLDQRVAQAMQHVARTDVPDMPDRIIAATALYLGIPVISRDGRIQTSSLTTIW